MGVSWRCRDHSQVAQLLQSLRAAPIQPDLGANHFFPVELRIPQCSGLAHCRRSPRPQSQSTAEPTPSAEVSPRISPCFYLLPSPAQLVRNWWFRCSVTGITPYETLGFHRQVASQR